MASKELKKKMAAQRRLNAEAKESRPGGGGGGASAPPPPMVIDALDEQELDTDGRLKKRERAPKQTEKEKRAELLAKWKENLPSEEQMGAWEQGPQKPKRKKNIVSRTWERKVSKPIASWYYRKR